MILLDNIVEIFTLANFDALVFVGIVLLDTGCIGAAFVNIDQAGFAVGADGFVQKPSYCFLITLGSKQEVDSLALLVDGAIEILPLTPDFDIRLIQPPAMTNPLLVFPESFLGTRRVVDDPALNGAMIHSVAALLH